MLPFRIFTKFCLWAFYCLDYYSLNCLKAFLNLISFVLPCFAKLYRLSLVLGWSVVSSSLATLTGEWPTVRRRSCDFSREWIYDYSSAFFLYSFSSFLWNFWSTMALRAKSSSLRVGLVYFGLLGKDCLWFISDYFGGERDPFLLLYWTRSVTETANFCELYWSCSLFRFNDWSWTKLFLSAILLRRNIAFVLFLLIKFRPCNDLFTLCFLPSKLDD